MPGINTFTQEEIGDRWAESLKKCDAAIKGLEKQIDAADKALIEAGIASVGSMADRIRRLANERDEFVKRAKEITGREFLGNCEICGQMIFIDSEHAVDAEGVYLCNEHKP